MTQYSGLITITTAGTAVRGTDIKGSKFAFIAPAANTGVVYAGNDGAGDVTAAADMPVLATQYLFVEVNNLNELWFDAASNGDEIRWVRVR